MTRTVALLLLLAAATCELGPAKPVQADALLEEVVTFTGDVLYLQTKVPALVIGAVRNGEIAIHGVGKPSDGEDAPDGDTLSADRVDHKGVCRTSARGARCQRQPSTR